LRIITAIDALANALEVVQLHPLLCKSAVEKGTVSAKVEATSSSKQNKKKVEVTSRQSVLSYRREPGKRLRFLAMLHAYLMPDWQAHI
jgi:hypothetical protein